MRLNAGAGERAIRHGSTAAPTSSTTSFLNGTLEALLRTIEGWLRADRDAKRSRGAKMTETAERAGQEELRGATGNGYLPGRFNQGFA